MYQRCYLLMHRQLVVDEQLTDVTFCEVAACLDVPSRSDFVANLATHLVCAHSL